jgi:hypothetical protein
MDHGFFRSLLLTLLLAFCAASLFWLFRHLVERAFYETGAGWRESLEIPVRKPGRQSP